jgi:hypothetical protein
MCKVYAATQRLYHQQLAQELAAAGIDPGAAPQQPINLRTAAPKLWLELQPIPSISGSSGAEVDEFAKLMAPLFGTIMGSAAAAADTGSPYQLDLLHQVVLPDLVTLVTQGGLLPVSHLHHEG